MGQALQKVRGGGGAGGAGGAALRGGQHVSHKVEPVRSSPSPSQQTVRQSVEVKPQAPEPQRIIEPEPIKGEWDRGDPKYSMMVQQVVGKISTRPGGEQEMGNAHVAAEFRRPKPANRRTTAATGPDEEHVVAAGTLNIAGIREALRLHQGLGEDQETPLDVKTLAAKFNVDAVQLEKVLRYTSLPQTKSPLRGTNSELDVSKCWSEMQLWLFLGCMHTHLLLKLSYWHMFSDGILECTLLYYHPTCATRQKKMHGKMHAPMHNMAQEP